MDIEKIRKAAANGSPTIEITEEADGLENASNPQFDVMESIRAEAETLQNDDSDEKPNSLFVLKTANKWMEDAKHRPIPKMLFGEFWFEGEVCILFADTGLGKSILAVQIAESIASGRQFERFLSVPPRQKVLYLDFELSEKQFEARYAIESGNFYTNHYKFDENFIRAEINPDSSLNDEFNDYEHFLNDSIELAIIDSGVKIVIVDNLTYLRNETEKARNALPLMKHLKALKRKYDLSILVLAHTPKRDLSKPITRNDLQGSKMLINFCDSSFAIGESNKVPGLRYLKQIKVRNASFTHDSENVQLCRVEKPSNFLQFELTGFGSEREHLRELSDKDKEELVEQVKALSDTGKSQRDIAAEVGCSAATVNRILNKK